eukprot:765170-Hanusia_phi.AAC.2
MPAASAIERQTSSRSSRSCWGTSLLSHWLESECRRRPSEKSAREDRVLSSSSSRRPEVNQADSAMLSMISCWVRLRVSQNSPVPSHPRSLDRSQSLREPLSSMQTCWMNSLTASMLLPLVLCFAATLEQAQRQAANRRLLPTLLNTCCTRGRSRNADTSSSSSLAERGAGGESLATWLDSPRADDLPGEETKQSSAKLRRQAEHWSETAMVAGLYCEQKLFQPSHAGDSKVFVS